MAICLTAEKFTQRISDELKPSQWTKSLQKGWHFHWQISYQQGGMTCHYPAHLRKSGQDSKKSLKNYRVTRGKSPSPSLGALNINLSEGLRTIKHFLAVSQTLATRGNDKSPQNPSHRMIPQQEYNLWPPFPSWINLKNPRGLPPTKMSPL